MHRARGWPSASGRRAPSPRHTECQGNACLFGRQPREHDPHGQRRALVRHVLRLQREAPAEGERLLGGLAGIQQVRDGVRAGAHELRVREHFALHGQPLEAADQELQPGLPVRVGDGLDDLLVSLHNGLVQRLGQGGLGRLQRFIVRTHCDLHHGRLEPLRRQTGGLVNEYRHEGSVVSGVLRNAGQQLLVARQRVPRREHVQLAPTSHDWQPHVFAFNEFPGGDLRTSQKVVGVARVVVVHVHHQPLPLGADHELKRLVLPDRVQGVVAGGRREGGVAEGDHAKGIGGVEVDETEKPSIDILDALGFLDGDPHDPKRGLVQGPEHVPRGSVGRQLDGHAVGQHQQLLQLRVHDLPDGFADHGPVQYSRDATELKVDEGQVQEVDLHGPNDGNAVDQGLH
mmetsp:Transcript_70187/g.117084  ORF Transcript_70187/g.117084 Transcript_70187/m.117084 type:complete len:400 (+) Transcript_70187:608-1807(+)